jgi:hypothetical protein
MQMQVIVSACFSLYTYESNSGAPQPAISLTQQNSHFSRNKQPLQSQQTTSSTTTNSYFNYNQKPFSSSEQFHFVQ